MRPQPGPGFRWVEREAGPALVCTALDAVAPHVFTTRRWTLGSADADVDVGWRQVAAAIGVAPERLARVRQVHGASVVVVRKGEEPPRDPLPEADILLTDDPATAVAVQTADCVPLLVVDPRTGAVAAAHAGWRGLSARVPERTVDALTREFGARRGDLVAAIGPAISGPRYEVGADVFKRFEGGGFAPADLARWFTIGARPEHWWFDGPLSARDQLTRAGVPDAQICSAALCTATHGDLLCSYRRAGTASGRMAAVIRPRFGHI